MSEPANILKKRSNGLETSRRILEVAVEEMDQSGPAKFNLDRVIERAKVSRSSVYHHFGNREGVIIAVELHQLGKSMADTDREARMAMETITDARDAWMFIELAVRSSATVAQKATRVRRISSFAAAQHAPALMAALRDLQEGACVEFTGTLRLAAERGFIDPVEPLSGSANFIQSFLMGRILVDILEDDAAEEEWHQAAMVALSALLRPRT